MLRLTTRRIPAAAASRLAAAGSPRAHAVVRSFATEPPTAPKQQDASKSESSTDSDPSAATTTSTAAAAAATTPSTSGPKISRPDDQPYDDPSASASSASSGLRRVAYSAAFLVAVGTAGTLYQASHDDKFRNKLKDQAPYLPWDSLVSSAQVVEKSVVKVAKEVEEKVVGSASKAVVEPPAKEQAAAKPVVEKKPAAKTVEVAATPKAVAEEIKDQVKEPVKPKRSPSPTRAAPAVAAADKPAENKQEPTATGTAAASPAAAAAAVGAALASTATAPAEPTAEPRRPTGKSATIDSLSHSLARLNSLFTALAQTSPEVRPSVAKIRGLLRSAEADLDAVAAQLDLLTDAQHELVSAVLAQQADEFAAQLKKHELALKAQFDVERDQLDQVHKGHLAEVDGLFRKEAAAKQAEWTAATKQLLDQQAKELDSTWRRQMQDRLDHERHGRLARLDHLTLKLKYLERVCFVNAEKLHASYHVHSLYSALQALSATLFDAEVAHDAARSPAFAAQWQLLHKLALGDEVIKATLNTVPEDVQHTGVATFPELHWRFAHVVAPEVRRAAMLPTDDLGQGLRAAVARAAGALFPTSALVNEPSADASVGQAALPPVGLVSYTISKVLASVLVAKPPALYKEKDINSVLARVEFHLQREDLEAAARELNVLRGWPREIAKGWLAEARMHLEVKMAVDVMQTQVGLMSLGAV